MDLERSDTRPHHHPIQPGQKPYPHGFESLAPICSNLRLSLQEGVYGLKQLRELGLSAKWRLEDTWVPSCRQLARLAVWLSFFSVLCAVEAVPTRQCVGRLCGC